MDESGRGSGERRSTESRRKEWVGAGGKKMGWLVGVVGGG